MKINKSIICIVAAIAIMFSLSACKTADSDTQKTTEVATQSTTSAEIEETAQSTTAESDKKSTTEKSTKSNDSDKEKKDNKETKVTKPSKPSKIDSLKVSNVTKNSAELTWSKVNCDGYQIAVSDDDGASWTTLNKTYKKTSYTVKDLTSYTQYKFRVRAYNKNSAGTSTSEWKTADAKTKASSTSRKITMDIILANNNSNEDTLKIYVNDKLIKTDKVNCDGSRYTYKTDKKYKGAVTVKATLKDSKTSCSVKTDKNSVVLDLSQTGIDVFDGEDD